jgi:hypothetical protein
MKKWHWILLIAVLVCGLAGAIFLHVQNTKERESPEVGLGMSTVDGNQNYTIEVDEGGLEDITPDLNRAVTFGESIPTDVRTLIGGRIEEVTARLKEDAFRADDWMTLAVLYHSANDYEGAREVWEFLLQVLEDRQKAVVYDNLGKLYKFQLKEYQKSEAYFKSSMAADPDSLTPYLELFELYRYLYKTDTSAAVQILNEASKKFPEETDPYTLLAAYHRERKEYGKARDAYLTAMDLARTQGNQDLTLLIGNELATLPE